MSPPEPGVGESAWGFTKGLGQGAWAGAKSMVGGAVDLAKMSASGLRQLGSLAKQALTDPQTREDLWSGTKEAAREAKEAGAHFAEDPASRLKAAKDGVLAAANKAAQSVKQSYQDAKNRGEGANFVGQAVGRIGFEVGSLFIGLGEASKAGKLAAAERGVGEAVEIAECPLARLGEEGRFSGGRPAVAESPFNPGSVNDRSADFYKMYDGSDSIRGTLNNVEARRWYLAEDAKIIDSLDKAAPIKAQAEKAHEMRNINRTRTRELMSDRVTADRLAHEEPNLTFEQLVKKREEAGLTGDDIYKSIINSSQKTRASVNKQLGL